MYILNAKVSRHIDFNCKKKVCQENQSSLDFLPMDYYCSENKNISQNIFPSEHQRCAVG